MCSLDKTNVKKLLLNSRPTPTTVSSNLSQKWLLQASPLNWRKEEEEKNLYTYIFDRAWLYVLNLNIQRPCVQRCIIMETFQEFCCIKTYSKHINPLHNWHYWRWLWHNNFHCCIEINTSGMSNMNKSLWTRYDK